MDAFNEIIEEMNPKLLVELAASKIVGTPSDNLLGLMDQLLAYYCEYKNIDITPKVQGDFMRMFSTSWMLFNPKNGNDPFMFFYFIAKSTCMCCCLREKEKLAA